MSLVAALVGHPAIVHKTFAHALLLHPSAVAPRRATRAAILIAAFDASADALASVVAMVEGEQVGWGRARCLASRGFVWRLCACVRVCVRVVSVARSLSLSLSADHLVTRLDL